MSMFGVKKGLIALSCVSVLALSAYAGTFEKNVAESVKKNMDMDIKVIKSIPIKEFNNIKFVEIEIEKQKQRFPLFASSDGKSILGFSKIMFMADDKTNEKIKSSLDSMMKYNDGAKDLEIKKMLESLPKDSFIELGNKKGDVMYIISDPECPYCRRELGNLSKHIKDKYVKMVIAPVHKESAFIKGQLIYDETKKAKTDKEKVAIIEKYFDKDYKLTDKQKKIDPKTVQKNVDVVFSSGLIRGVPYVFVDEKK